MSALTHAAQVIDLNHTDVVPYRLVEPSRVKRAARFASLGEPMRLSYADPTGETAISQRPDSAQTFQCVSCHALGSSVDHNAWVILAGVRVHIRNDVTERHELDLFGDELVTYESLRLLCGPARIVAGRTS